MIATLPLFLLEVCTRPLEISILCLTNLLRCDPEANQASKATRKESEERRKDRNARHHYAENDKVKDITKRNEP